MGVGIETGFTIGVFGGLVADPYYWAKRIP